MILKYNPVLTAMDCPICGEPADDNVKSCSRCGTKFTFLSSEKDNFKKATEMIRAESKGKGKR